jgi:glycerophosphoryl diester phosphodiesterase
MPISAVKLDATAVDVRVTDDRILVVLADGRELAAPLAWSPRLTEATTAQRKNWRLIGRGQGIHWPDVDEDISIASLLKQA